MTDQHKLLLVAGRKADTEHIQQVLDGTPFALDIIESYQAALDQIRHGAYDACLIDQQIGQKSGLEMIREARPFQNALILLANEDDPTLDAAALEAGAVAFLVIAELTTATLTRALRYAIRNHQALDDAARRAEQYLDILHEQGELIGRFTPDFRLTFANDAYREMFGVGEMNGEDLMHYLLPGDRAGLIAHLESLSPENPMGHHENRSLLPDGSIRWTAWMNRAIYNADNELVEYQSVGRDVTEIKTQAQALRESEARYRSLIERLPEAILVLIDEKVAYVNDAGVRLYGVDSQANLVGRSPLEFALPEEHAAIRKHMEIVFRLDYRPIVAPGKLVRDDGEVLDVEAHGTATVFEGRPAILVHLRDVSAQRKAEQALRENEARSRAIIEDQLDFIVRWKSGGIRTFVNDAYCRYFGISREEAVGTSFFPLIVEEDRIKVRNRIAQLSPENPASYDIHRIIRADGSIGWNEWVDHAIFGDQGDLIEVQSVGRDITERKLADETIRESEARYRSLVELSPDAVLVIADEKLVFANSAAARHFGAVSPEYLIGTQMLDYVLREYHDDARRLIDIVLQRGHIPTPIKVQAVRLDGRLVDSEVHGVAISFEGQRAVLAIMRDVSVRTAMERDLRESELRYRTLFEGIDDTIFVHDSQANILEVNDAACRRLGYTREELLTMKTTDIDAPDYATGFSARWDEQAGKGQLNSIGAEYITKDGRSIFVDINTTFINYEGQPAVLAVVRDVTQMREAEQALRDRHHELETVARVARAATSTLNIKDMLTEVAQILTTALDVTSTYVFDLDFEAESTSIITAYLSENATQNEQLPRIGIPFSLADRPRLLAWKTDPDMVIVWQRDDPTLSKAEREVFRRYSIYSVLGIPLHSGGVVIGYMSFWEVRYRREFSEAEVRLLQSIGGLIGVSLANAQLYDKLRESEASYRTLFEGADDTIFVHDSQANILEVNDAAARRLGLHARRTSDHENNRHRFTGLCGGFL